MASKDDKDTLPSGKWLPPRDAPKMPSSLEALVTMQDLLKEELGKTQVLLDDALRQRDSLRRKREKRGQS